jgi:hypothetical protein
MLCNNLYILLIARNGSIVYVCNLKTTVTWTQQCTGQVPKYKDGWEGDTKEKHNWCKCSFFRHFVINICCIPLILYGRFRCKVEQHINFSSCGLWINLSLIGHQVVLKHTDNYSIHLFIYVPVYLLIEQCQCVRRHHTKTDALTYVPVDVFFYYHDFWMIHYTCNLKMASPQYVDLADSSQHPGLWIKTSHPNGCTPVWTQWSVSRSLLRVNYLLHTSQGKKTLTTKNA